MNEFKNQVALDQNSQLKKCELVLLFNTNMPEPFQVGYCIIVRYKDTVFQYIIEEVELYPNVKLF